MKKALGIAVALTFGLALTAAAAEHTTGTIRAFDPTDQSIILDDGTKISVSSGQFTEMEIGEKVSATFEVKGDKNVATEVKVDAPAVPETD